MVGQEIGQWVACVRQDAIARVGQVYVASQLGVEISNFVLQADALVNTEIGVEQALLQVCDLVLDFVGFVAGDIAEDAVVIGRIDAIVEEAGVEWCTIGSAIGLPVVAGRVTVPVVALPVVTTTAAALSTAVVVVIGKAVVSVAIMIAVISAVKIATTIIV